MPSTDQLSRLLATEVTPARTVAYGAHPDQIYDVHEPSLPRGVLVVLLHGGFWRPEYDRSHTAAQATALAHQGFHVAVGEYRRAPRAGWPVLSADLVALSAAVRSDSALPCPVLAMGHSAGGHLALWLQHQEVARGMLGTVALAPCAHLRRTYDLALGDAAALALMGTRPQQAPAAWHAADPARLGRPPAPVRIVHGDADPWVPLEVSQAYATSTDSAHVHLDVVPGAGHYDLIDPESPHFARVLAAAGALAD